MNIALGEIRIPATGELVKTIVKIENGEVIVNLPPGTDTRNIYRILTVRTEGKFLQGQIKKEVK